MKLNYELVSPHELTKAEQILLNVIKKVDFSFFRYHGVLKINKELPQADMLAEIAVAMWQIGRPLDGELDERMDELDQQVRQIAGEDAACQLRAAWGDALKEKLDADNKLAASEWLQDRDIPSELDAIWLSNGDYNAGLIKALWHQTLNMDAVFLYGYQVGMEAAKKAMPAI